MKLYIAGPMTGIADHNFPAFTEAASKYRRRGYDVVSPHELHPHTDKSWHWYLKRDLKAMLDCDAVVVLRGWHNSRGARLERATAEAVNMPVYIDQHDLLVGAR